MWPSPRGSVDSQPRPSLGAGLLWLQVAFVIAGCLAGWAVTSYAYFGLSIVVPAIIVVFVIGNMVVAPTFLVLFVLCDGRAMSLWLAMGVGAPVALTLLGFLNNPASVVWSTAGANWWIGATDLLHITAIGLVSGLIVSGIRTLFGRFIARRPLAGPH